MGISILTPISLNADKLKSMLNSLSVSQPLFGLSIFLLPSLSKSRFASASLMIPLCSIRLFSHRCWSSCKALEE